MTASLDRAMLLQIAQELADVKVELSKLTMAKKPFFLNPRVIQDEKSKQWLGLIEDKYGQRTPIGLFADAGTADEAQKAKQAEFEKRIEELKERMR